MARKRRAKRNLFGRAGVRKKYRSRQGKKYQKIGRFVSAIRSILQKGGSDCFLPLQGDYSGCSFKDQTVIDDFR